MELSLDKVAELLNDSYRIVLTAHIHPDGDSLGSMLALNEHLLQSGKKVSMLLDDNVPDMFSFLSGHQNILTAIDGLQIESDLLVVIDASDIERIGAVKKCCQAPVLNIDHHISNTKFADYWYIDTNSAASGEIIYQLLKLLDANITKTMATCLFTAIATDCGFFRYANTTANTLRFAADLMEIGAQPNLISEYIETRPLTAIFTLTKVLQTLELHYHSRIAAITVSNEILDESYDNTEGFINYPRIIDGVEIALMFKAVDGSNIRVSFRSKNVDVSKIAFSFGGGGHARAAGCTVNEPLEIAKQLIINACIKALMG